MRKKSIKKLNLEEIDVLNVIKQAIFDKKGESPLLMNLKEIKGASFDYYVIASGNSTTQTDAIANEIIDQVREQMALKPYHTEGLHNAEWILLDYYSILIHIFLKEKREYFQIEELWADSVFEHWTE
jgi:ribosome-associated protein